MFNQKKKSQNISQFYLWDKKCLICKTTAQGITSSQSELICFRGPLLLQRQIMTCHENKKAAAVR